MSKDLNDYLPVPDYSRAGPDWVQLAFDRDKLQRRFDRAQEEHAKVLDLETRRQQFVQDAQVKREEARQKRGEEEEVQTRGTKVGIKDQSESPSLSSSLSADRRNAQHRRLKRLRGEGVASATTHSSLEQIPRRTALSAYPPYAGPELPPANMAKSDLAALLPQQSPPSAPRMNGNASSPRPQPVPQHSSEAAEEDYYTALRSTAQQQPQNRTLPFPAKQPALPATDPQRTTTKPSAKFGQGSMKGQFTFQLPSLDPATRQPPSRDRGEKCGLNNRSWTETSPGDCAAAAAAAVDASLGKLQTGYGWRTKLLD
ncbi:hypothetical protein CERZMDRAFT_88802 [Cercospora zeae-maydis SCOH1-5]|uniref:Uncharacterized protein n=1 Tax=Cercospora zeae-maydis SCOH1-5 TaxID=717836 RepID=A0A6A6EZB5_9PEZI|nr:hypothetical protein CERZMDRAFT_88802 [Cercospora zeae-maydis SCOH1-5]